MATAAKTVDYPHIVRTPGVRGGKARIDGTRICVVDVAIAYQQAHKPEEIQTYFSSRPLTLAEVMSALAYHYDHPEAWPGKCAQPGAKGSRTWMPAIVQEFRRLPLPPH